MRGQDRVPDLPGEGSDVRQSRPAGTVRGTVAEGERRGPRSWVRWAAIALSVALTSGGVLLGTRFMVEAGTERAESVPERVLDARLVTAVPDTPAPQRDGAVPGSTRFTPMEPALVLDTRGLGVLAPGAEVTVPVPALPAGSAAALVEVSLLAATGAGEVDIDGGAGRLTVLRVPRAGAQVTATVVIPVGPDRRLRASTRGGGDLLINLVGAFELAQASSAGRIVPVAPTRVLRLVPRSDGKKATIRLSAVPELRRAGPVSALLLQVAADVGPKGGFVAAGSSAGDLDQTVFWTATSGTDRTRGGLLVVPVTGGSVSLRYEAGMELRADLVGYVTGEGAPTTGFGLVVPVPSSLVRPAPPVRVPAGGAGTDVEVIPPEGIAGVPADRVAATLLTVTATGDRTGAVAVHAPGTARPANPTVVAPAGAKRSAVTLVGTVAGEVRIGSEAGASVSATPLLLVLGA